MSIGTGLSRRERQIMDILYQGGKLSAAAVRQAMPDAPSYSAVRAMLRVLQCVAFRGVLCKVASTTAVIFSGGILGLRPGRGASFSKPGTRNARKRCRQSCTVGRDAPRTWAISWLATPSAAIVTIRARITCR